MKRILKFLRTLIGNNQNLFDTCYFGNCNDFCKLIVPQQESEPPQSKGRFTRSNFDPINIEDFCVRDGICLCSHDPVFASNYFMTSSKNFNNSCFENFMPTSPQLHPAVVAIL